MKKVLILGLLFLCFQVQKEAKAQNIKVVDSFMLSMDSFMHALASNGEVADIDHRGMRIKTVSVSKVDKQVYRIERKVKYRKGVQLEKIKVTIQAGSNSRLLVAEALLVNGEYTYLQKVEYGANTFWKKTLIETATKGQYIRANSSSRYSFWTFIKK